MKPNRATYQRLCIALDMTLSDGSPISIGGPKCPPDRRIVERLKALGWGVRRLSRDERSDRLDDGVGGGRHVSVIESLPPTVQAILSEPSGLEDCDGPLTVEEALLLGI